MRDRENAWLRHQQQRFMRPDAARYLRPDAARFLKPGTDPVEVYTALSLKYSADQPRIPRGRTGGGRWSHGDTGGDPATPSGIAEPMSFADPAADPMGNIDFGDLGSLGEGSGLFEITPSETDNTGVQLAGDPPPPGIGTMRVLHLRSHPKFRRSDPRRVQNARLIYALRGHGSDERWVSAFLLIFTSAP